MNKIPDSIFKPLSDILLKKILPNDIASKSLITMPRIAPSINEILYAGYCIPKPIEAKKVLSPSSPIIIENAIMSV